MQQLHYNNYMYNRTYHHGVQVCHEYEQSAVQHMKSPFLHTATFCQSAFDKHQQGL